MISFDYVQKEMTDRWGLEEQPHFEKISFRKNKKIFLTYDAKEELICVKLSKEDQQSFELLTKGIIYAVPNKWGLQGWTLARMKHLTKVMYNDLIASAMQTFK